jgi:hypothetical protein
MVVGFLVGAGEVLRMSHWDLNTSMREVALPIFLFGAGLGSVFPTITALGIGQVRRERIGFASALFSMMINIGAATGIAAITNYLTARHQFHQAEMARTLAGANHIMMTGVIKSQAWLLAYNDVYRAIAILILLLAPWSMLFKANTSGGSAESIIE